MSAPTNTEGRFNLPIPFGWFAIAKSDELAPGEVKPISAFATEFVLWRGADGVARALDAWCPHLGAHLGHGGEVVGDDIRCPFHHWSFKGDGSVADIPYAKLVPPKLKKPCDRAWPVYEDMGIVFVWHHPHKAAPLWEIGPVTEIADEGWLPSHYHDWIFDVHIQELTENGADTAHFGALHGTRSPPVPEMKIDGWTRHSSVSTKMPTPRGDIDGTISVRAPGPGLSFTRFHGITELLLLQMQTPLDGDRTHLRHLYFHPAVVDERKVGVTKALIRETQRQLEQDSIVWPYKKHLREPLLVDGDGPILAYRQHYARYYA
jgi:phenylpropionate dioxygenase-like ring-hydroxylating dioxygenase large terminal subunit